MSKRVISKQFTLAWRDIVRGLIMAIVTPAILIVQQSVEAGILTFDWHNIAMASVAGGLAYILKNFLEPTKVIQKV
jgi:hypothetical protein